MVEVASPASSSPDCWAFTAVRCTAALISSGAGSRRRGLTAALQAHAGLRLASRHSCFDMSPDSHIVAEVLNEIREFAPQILFVGMGMPRQEHWIHANQRNLESKIVLSVGAAFDYEAGVQPPPLGGKGWGGVAIRWIGGPQRLFSRYCKAMVAHRTGFPRPARQVPRAQDTFCTSRETPLSSRSWQLVDQKRHGWRL